MNNTTEAIEQLAQHIVDNDIEYAKLLPEIHRIVGRKMLVKTFGNQSAAAELLGVNRGTYRKWIGLVEKKL